MYTCIQYNEFEYSDLSLRTIRPLDLHSLIELFKKMLNKKF